MGSRLHALLDRRDAIRGVVERNAARAPRLFGSVARGDDSAGSDVDLLVDALPGCSLLDLGGIEIELGDLLGQRFDVRTIDDLHPKLRAAVLEQAIAL